MIHFDPVEEPSDFDQAVRKPGLLWLETNPNAKRPKALWSPFRAHLATGFGWLCAYSAMYEPVGTVDHFVSWDEDKTKAYDWSNFRYAASWINSSKKSLPAAKILDPFQVQDDWFELLLPSLQLTVTDTTPQEFKERAKFVLRRLHLRDDHRVMKQREEWYHMYQNGEISLEGLEKKAPLIARAVRKANA
ncbi:MAG: hypothetical protein QNK37_37600 [Acidobacteriota bacterium]|nr:hypothetical protein [Acidobacteriota bacterium]